VAEGLHDHLRGDALLERLYCDVLGRPMRGSAEITGQERAAHGDLIMAPAAVTVHLDDAGRLAVDLPAGTYRITAALTAGDGARVHETETVESSAHWAVLQRH